MSRVSGGRGFRSALGIGIAAPLALGATLFGAGTASASNNWSVDIYNNSLQGADGVMVFSRAGQFQTRCYPVDHSRQFTQTSGRLSAGQVVTLQAYRDSNCQGAKVGLAIDYNLRVDMDRQQTGLNCDLARIRVDRGFIEWWNCG